MVPDPDEAVNREVRLTASFEAKDGTHGSDARTVNRQWESSLEQP